MKLVVTATAAKALRRIPAKDAVTISARLKDIAAAPFASHGSVKPLKGMQDSFRLRVGNWRALYSVDRTTQEVVLQDVLKREEAYR